MSARNLTRGRAARPMSHRSRLVTVFIVVAALIGGTSVAQSNDAAFADAYPSWDDVQNARQNESAKQAEVANVQALLAGLQSTVASTAATATQLGEVYQEAQQKFDEAQIKSESLKMQADAAEAQANLSQKQAGRLAAQLSRSGGDDLSTTLFFSGTRASQVLSQLGLANMVKSQSAGVYARATQDRNTAQALTDQAILVRAALQVLADAAKSALKQAAAAAEAASAALDAQQVNQARLEAQLATMVTDVQHTEAEYTAGIKAQWGDDAGLGSGKISDTGWTRPAGGHISSPFGYRLNPFTHDYAFHAGTDLGANCNSPIFAGHSGTVIYAGWNGGYGNFVLIDDGDGISTGYGHIVNGGIHVSIGQKVGVGQPIALVGSTGHSTGCHLHYEVRQGGVAFDAVPFMRQNGIELAN